MAASGVRIELDHSAEPFPRIHEGRYEVDPEKTRIVPPSARLVEATRRAGVRLLRVGVGVWLPSQEPNEQEVFDREWFRGTKMDDTSNEDLYTWTHLDRVVDTCLALGCDLLLSVDYMPETLALRRPYAGLPEWARQAEPTYTFPNGVRDAPPADPQVFSAAALHLLDHVKGRGARVRYVELWNEPDLPLWWSGSFEEFWEMYSVFARAASEAGYPVGGPAWAGLEPELWLNSFVENAGREKVPLDFYSWHHYPRTPEAIGERARLVRRTLDEAGLASTQSFIDEWGYDLADGGFFGTVAHAAFTAACFMSFPEWSVAVQTESLLVDPVPPGSGRFHGLTTRDGDPNPVLFTHEAFEAFQSTPFRLKVGGHPYVVAGVDESRTRMQVIASNPSSEPVAMTVSVEGGSSGGSIRRLTQSSFDTLGGWSDREPASIPGDFHLEGGSLLVYEGSVDK